MKTFLLFGAVLLLSISLTSFTENNTSEGWITLFDGKSLNNWKVGEHSGSFSVKDGAIVVNGERAHLVL